MKKERESRAGVRARGSPTLGPEFILASSPPTWWILPLLFLRSADLHGVWICGVQEARARPESPQTAAGKRGFTAEVHGDTWEVAGRYQSTFSWVHHFPWGPCTINLSHPSMVIHFIHNFCGLGLYQALG